MSLLNEKSGAPCGFREFSFHGIFIRNPLRTDCWSAVFWWSQQYWFNCNNCMHLNLNALPRSPISNCDLVLFVFFFFKLNYLFKLNSSGSIVIIFAFIFSSNYISTCFDHPCIKKVKKSHAWGIATWSDHA